MSTSTPRSTEYWVSTSFVTGWVKTFRVGNIEYIADSCDLLKVFVRQPFTKLIEWLESKSYDEVTWEVINAND